MALRLPKQYHQMRRNSKSNLSGTAWLAFILFQSISTSILDRTWKSKGKLFEAKHHRLQSWAMLSNRTGMMQFFGSFARSQQNSSIQNFRCYPENWLLIYDNWSPHIPDSEVDAMIIKINQYLSESSWRHPFDRIFIQSSERMWKLS